ncbi:MAG: DUF2318 domain-containing protein [Clostridia bacterium]|nr:DUF2318 domain-containing protein [Clostridia bacterium]
MLKYLEIVTEDMLMVSVLICLFWSLCKLAFGRKGDRFILVGMAVGVAASAWMSWAKNNTSRIATNEWNFYIFLCTMVFTILFMIFSVVFGRRHRKLTAYGSDTDAGIGVGGWMVGVTGATLTALLLFYELPDVMAYPFNFDTMGKGFLSAEYFTRLAGWALALILLWVFVRFLYLCAMALDSTRVTLWVMNLALLVNAGRCFGMALSKWTGKARWLTWLPRYSSGKYPWAFPIAKFATNNTLLFAILIAGLSLAIPLILFAKSLRITKPYSNPAQLRKLKSINRHQRRIALVVAACFALAMVNMTVVHALNNQEVTLSAPETYEIRGTENPLEEQRIYIALTQVNDGNLHRFEYVTENKVDVRWIVVQKPGSGTYGVGLDACDVCGTAGYFQRGEQVICKRCDVVMNINTIGFKGGCNPIPLNYSIADGYMIFEMKDILAAEREFK